MRILRTAVLAAMMAVTATAAHAAQVVLKSEQNGRYVTAAGGILAATARSPDAALKLDIVRLAGGTVAFRLRDGRYIRAGIGEGTLVGIGGDRAAGWETFRLQNLGGGRMAIRSMQNNLYVRAGVGQGTRLAAVSPHVRGWETFSLVEVGAAAAPQPPQAIRIEGRYALVAVDSAPVPPEVRRTVEINFSAGGRLSGRGVCNSFDATWSLAGERITIGPILSTKMLCRENAAWERAIFQRLGQASAVRPRRGGIVLTIGGTEALALARR